MPISEIYKMDVEPTHYKNKTKVISADLLDLDFDFKDIIMFGNISVLVTFQFWWHFSFDKISVLVTF